MTFRRSMFQMFTNDDPRTQTKFRSDAVAPFYPGSTVAGMEVPQVTTTPETIADIQVLLTDCLSTQIRRSNENILKSSELEGLEVRSPKADRYGEHRSAGHDTLRDAID